MISGKQKEALENPHISAKERKEVKFPEFTLTEAERR